MRAEQIKRMMELPNIAALAPVRVWVYTKSEDEGAVEAAKAAFPFAHRVEHLENWGKENYVGQGLLLVWWWGVHVGREVVEGRRPSRPTNVGPADYAPSWRSLDIAATTGPRPAPTYAATQAYLWHVLHQRADLGAHTLFLQVDKWDAVFLKLQRLFVPQTGAMGMHLWTSRQAQLGGGGGAGGPRLY